MSASSLGIIGHTFAEPTERTRATARWGASLGAGIAAGPVVAATLDLFSDLRAAHWFTAIDGAVMALLARRLGLVELRSGGGARTPPRATSRFSLLGAGAVLLCRWPSVAKD